MKRPYNRDFIIDIETGKIQRFKRIKGRSLKNLFGSFGYRYHKNLPKNWKTIKLKDLGLGHERAT
jgi:hypothetical protein